MNADLRLAPPYDNGAHYSRPLLGKLPSALLIPALAALCLIGTISPAHADIDMALNTTNYNPQETSSTLSLDATVTEDGPSWGILCAVAWLRFDHSKVTISNFQGASANGWSCTAYNLDHVADGWAAAVFLNSGAWGQTESGTIGTFTVTPVNSEVDVNDCDTLRLDGDSSELCDQDYYPTYPSDPCNGRDYPIDDNPGEELIPSGPMGPSGPTTDDLPDVASCVRILRFVAGLAPADGQHWDRGWFDPVDPTKKDPLWNTPTRSNFLVFTDIRTCPPLYDNYNVNDIVTKTPPNVVVPPNTMVDQATLELTDPGGTIDGFVSGYDLTDWTVPDCPPYFDGYGRQFTIADAIMALRLPLTGPPEAAWKAGFIGNILSGGFPANSTGMPAISLLKPQSAPSTPPDLSNPWIAAFPMGTQSGTNAPDPSVYYNTNSMYLVSDLTGSGGYGIRSGTPTSPEWPRFLPDAPDGVSLADINGDGIVEVMAPDFQDAEGVHLFVWDYTGNGISPFAPYNLHSAYGVGTGHSDAPTSVYDITGDSIPELFFPYQGNPYRQGTRFGGIKVIAANGTTLYTAQDHGNISTPWSTYSGYFQSQFDAPPVLMPNVGTSSRLVVAGANSGDIYAWRTDTGHLGEMQSGFPIQLQPPGIWDINGNLVSRWTHNDIFDPAGYQIAANVAGDGHPELLFATGRHVFHADFDRPPHARHNDGAIYCYSDTGQQLWRYPVLSSPEQPADWKPAFASGLSIGRLHGPSGGLYVVAVDASGLVVALNAANGSVLWTYDINPIPGSPPHKTEHRYFQGVAA